MTSQPIKTAIILSAGFGSRLKPITDSIPKALIAVKDKPMLQHCIDRLVEVGIENIIINTHYKAEQIHEYFNNTPQAVEIKIIHEPEILGTGGGILNAMTIHGLDTMLAMNCDTLMSSSQPLHDLMSAWNPKTMDNLILLSPQERDNDDFALDEQGSLVRESDKRNYRVVSSYIVHRNYFTGKEVEFFGMQHLWLNFNPRSKGVVSSDVFVDIGSPQDLERANSLEFSKCVGGALKAYSKGVKEDFESARQYAWEEAVGKRFRKN